MAFAVSPGASSRLRSQVTCGEVAAKPRPAPSQSSIEDMGAHEEAAAGAVRSAGSCNRGRLSSLEEAEGDCMHTKEEEAAVQQQQQRRSRSRPGAQAVDTAAVTPMGTMTGGGGSAAGTAVIAPSLGRLAGRCSAAAGRKSASSSTREQRMFYGAFLLLGSIIAISQVVALPVLLQMLFYTGPILYIGSHASLKQNVVDACTGERTNRTEAMNHTDALLFPVFGSIALVTLYVAYKFLDASWVNFLLTLYLTAIGFFALGETINMALHPFLPAWLLDETRVVFRLPLPHIPLLFPAPAATEGPAVEGKAVRDRGNYVCTRSYAQLLSYGVAAALSVIWLWKKHWVVHNLLAIAFCIQAIGLVSVGNFTVATILLSGLFVYDIFWVFGTDVMVTVAKSFEGPAKLIFPAQLDPWQQSILGLGDIVVPGVLISMCLRFDYWLHSLCDGSMYSSSNKRSLEGAATDAAGAAAGDVGAAAETAAAAAAGAVLTRRAQAAAAAQADEEMSSRIITQQRENEASNSSNSNSNALASSQVHPPGKADDIVYQRFNKFYFWVVLIFYECGLITTGVVMLLFQHPQPALLYLVPFCLFSLFGAAALNGQVKEVLAYSEDDESAAAAAASEASAVEAEDAAASANAAGEEDEDEEDEEEGDKRKKVN